MLAARCVRGRDGVRLATLRAGGRDGTLIVVSRDSTRYLRAAPSAAATLQRALESWSEQEPLLRELDRRLADDPSSGTQLQLGELHSPLPRSYQWAEASSYLSHMERIRRARGMELPPDHERSVPAYQGGADLNLPPRGEVTLADEAWGLDIEGTVVVITDDVPRARTAEGALEHVKLISLANDFTFRHLLPAEYARGLGMYQAKPARPYAPFALTPDELGSAWDGRTVGVRVSCSVNDELLGAPNAGSDCAFGFGEIIAHLTLTRGLGAGTIVGSGTVSNRDPAAGHACLAERRAVEIAEHGSSDTDFLKVGDRVRVEAFDEDERSVFGAIEHVVSAGD
jgi:fumarylacetoacetate (FAA) hydrolase